MSFSPEHDAKEIEANLRIITSSCRVVKALATKMAKDQSKVTFTEGIENPKFKAVARGNDTKYVAINNTAKMCASLAGKQSLTFYEMYYVRQMGFDVNLEPGVKEAFEEFVDKHLFRGNKKP